MEASEIESKQVKLLLQIPIRFLAIINTDPKLFIQNYLCALLKMTSR